eukprot:6188685-Pleurochrysis_carterae.AAC.1
MKDQDEELLSGVPDDVEVDGVDDSTFFEETDEKPDEKPADSNPHASDAVKAIAEADSSDESDGQPETNFRRAHKESAPADEDMVQESVAAVAGETGPGGVPLYSGKRRVIQHSWDPDVIIGVQPDSAEEQARRAARAAKFAVGPSAETEEQRAKLEARAKKFGLPLPEPPAAGAPESAALSSTDVPMEKEVPLLTAEEVAAREARAAKFGVEAKNPLELIEKAAPKGAFWEQRRDAAPDETPRPEAVYVFGTDRLSTADLLGFFSASGIPVRSYPSPIGTIVVPAFPIAPLRQSSQCFQSCLRIH